MKIKEFGFTCKPCDDAVKWLRKQPDARTAWDTCERGDWMWWALYYLPGILPVKKISVRYARWCARRAKKYAVHADAVHADAAYASACASAGASAYADAAAATGDAAYASAYAAAYASAYAAAAAAAYAAASAAYAGDAAAYAGDAAELKAQADWIRKHVPFPLEEK